MIGALKKRMATHNSIIRPDFSKKTYSTYSPDSTVRDAQYYEEEEAYRRQQERSERWNRQIRERNIDEVRKDICKNAHVFSVSQILAIFVCVVVFLVSCTFFIGQMSSYAHGLKSLNSLRDEYAQIKSDNKAFEDTINSEINAEKIYNYAVGSLGYTYPDKNQIVTYDRNESISVEKSENIPR